MSKRSVRPSTSKVNASGGIRYRDGRYQARVRSEGQTYVRTFQSLPEAQKWLLEVELGLNKPATPAEPGVADADPGARSVIPAQDMPTLGQALGRYGGEVSRHHRGALVELARLGRLSRLEVIEQPLDTIKPAWVRQYRDRRLGAGAANNTVRLKLSLLSAVFKHAHTEWGLEGLGNPVAQIKRPRAGPGRQVRVDAEQEARLLAACSLARR